MSPFAHLLHELRMRHRIRQVQLAEKMGYEQSYISVMEAGTKGPPTEEFVERLIKTLRLSDDDATEVRLAAEASQRKVVIEAETPLEIYWMLSRLRAALPTLTSAQVRVISEVLAMDSSTGRTAAEPPRRLPRRSKEELQM